ncbi:sigma-70 family RNA polymerase sigma factor [Ralstonia insidiosa]|nr:sigma-70 family RNA polymerase sigma factor [Ralstonia insidiosa]MBA9937810.1 sigma-70 family RNA polymerase sigma factor [Ralstonia insidiosa]
MPSTLRYAQGVRCASDAVGIPLSHPVAGNRGTRNLMHVVGASLLESEDSISARQNGGREHLVQLLKQTAEGSRSAFAELYTLTSPKLYSLAYGILRSSGEAEDVLQEIYVAIWQRADQFDPGRGTAMTWLISLARNKAIDRLRQARETAGEETDWTHIIDEQATPPAAAGMTQERRRLEGCIQKLEARQRGVIVEAFYTGASYPDLAARLSVPIGTMKSWVRRSLLQLKTCLEQQP